MNLQQAANAAETASNCTGVAAGAALAVLALAAVLWLWQNRRKIPSSLGLADEIRQPFWWWWS